MAAIVIPESAISPRLRDFLDLWQSRRLGRPLPERADFDVLEIFPWLGGIHLIERLDDGDLFVRVFGTISANRMKIDLTGRRMQEFADHPRIGAMVRAGILEYGSALGEGRPVFHRIETQQYGRYHFRYDRGIFPVAVAGVPRMLFVVMDYSV